MRFDIVTIFPAFFDGPFRHGILHRALQFGIAAIGIHDLRSFTHDRHQIVDDRPFGGGEGMVLKPEPIYEAITSLGIADKSTRNPDRESVVLLSAQGRRFTQTTAHQLARLDRVVFICGRYEGVDERITDLLVDRELSIGDYVLSGGELAAAVIVDSVVRLLPGVLGNEASSHNESFGASEAELTADLDAGASELPRSTHGAGGLLDYPHYTRPAEFRGIAIPEVLASGNHELIRQWRRRKALEKTLKNRPDLLAAAPLTKEDRRIVDELLRAKSEEFV